MKQSTFDLNGLDQTPIIACGEQPQQRFEAYGAGALSDTELIALLLHGGIQGHSALGLASQLIAQAGSIAGLASWQPTDFQRLKGIGRSKARQLAALVEVGRRMMKDPSSEAPCLNRPELIAAYLAPITKGMEVEKFWVFCLNRKNRLKKLVEITSGTATSTLVHPREVLRAAIQHGATGIACAHNLCDAAHRLCYVTSRAMWSNVVLLALVSLGGLPRSLHIVGDGFTVIFPLS